MRNIACLVICAVLALGRVDLLAVQTPMSTPDEAHALEKMAAAIPPGSRVTVHLTSGRHFKGTLMNVVDEAVIVKRNTRLPEPAVTVRFDELERLELDRPGGLSLGKAVGIGLAAGAGAILTLFVFALMIDD